MDRKNYFQAATCVGFLFGVGFLFAAFTPFAMATDGPNVILMVVDDWGWADWEKRSDFYETPNLTRLAERGVEFQQAYASSSVCSPTRASLLTGISPASHKITKWIPGNPNNIQTHPDEPLTDLNLSTSTTTLADALKTDGYSTAHIGKWHLGQQGNASADPTNFGFDVNVGGNHRGQPTSYTNRNSYINPNNHPNLDSSIQENFLTDHLAIEAKNYIEDRVANNEKFFLNYDFYGVHTPIQAHPDYIEYYQNKPAGEIHSNAAYATMLQAVDDALGTILDTLDQQRITDETLIIFTSDHGGLTSPNSVTSNAPLRGGKGQQWEGGHRVPLIVAGPGVQQGQVSDYQTISHDFYPTILEATGVAGDAAHNATVEGKSLVDVFSGADASDRGEALFWHLPHMSNHNGGPYGATVLGDWKFIENYQNGQQFLYLSLIHI